MPNHCREIRESDTFDKQKQSLGDIRRLDEALKGFIWLACRGPEEFPQIAPNSSVRIAEVGPLQKGSALQNYMILFRIEDDEGVELLWIEAVAI